jgi:hypothetical protein
MLAEKQLNVNCAIKDEKLFRWFLPHFTAFPLYRKSYSFAHLPIPDFSSSATP